MLEIVKRNGQTRPFDGNKIANAIRLANSDVPEKPQVTEEEIAEIVAEVTGMARSNTRPLHVEEIQDMVETGIMKARKFDVARAYITWRYRHTMVRRANTTDEKVMALIDVEHPEKHEGFKDAVVNCQQRDYIAGIISRDISKRLILDPEVVKAHEEGRVHIMYMDHYAQHVTGAGMINLLDMLDNGTVISETLIERPHSLDTACNITTQIIAQSASSQAGDLVISLAHLLPFIKESRMRHKKEIREEYGPDVSEAIIEKIAEMRLKKEMTKGVQCIQYQVLTLMTTNGKAPDISILLDIGEAKEEERDDLRAFLMEALEQRIQGVKGTDGNWYSPAQPRYIFAYTRDLVHREPALVAKALECSRLTGTTSFVNRDLLARPSYGTFEQGNVIVDASLNKKEAEVLHLALKKTHERLCQTSSDAAPLLWRYGALARLGKNESIAPLLKRDADKSYMTVTVAGLGDILRPEGRITPDSALAVGVLIEAFRSTLNEWQKEDRITYRLRLLPDGAARTEEEQAYVTEIIKKTGKDPSNGLTVDLAGPEGYKELASMRVLQELSAEFVLMVRNTDGEDGLLEAGLTRFQIESEKCE